MEIYAIPKEILGEHALSYATVKIGGPVEMCDFPSGLRLVLETQKSDPSRKFQKNSRINIGRTSDFGKSLSEQMGISRERDLYIICEIRTLRRFPQKGFQNV